MRYSSQQSGFTPTQTFTQSFFARIKRHSNVNWLHKFKIGIRREQSSQRKNLCRGFSLVETLVAITILLIVIIGPMTISSSAAKSTSFASEQVTAFFLAQEGAELMEKARNDLLLQNFSGSNPDPWADFTRTTNGGTYYRCYTVNGCNLSISDDNTGSLTPAASCSGQDSCVMNLDPLSTTLRSRFTASNSGSATIYSRTIRLQIVSANEVSVTSVVTWRSGFSRDAQQVTVQTSLFNIYESN